MLSWLELRWFASFLLVVRVAALSPFLVRTARLLKLALRVKNLGRIQCLSRCFFTISWTNRTQNGRVTVDLLVVILFLQLTHLQIIHHLFITLQKQISFAIFSLSEVLNAVRVVGQRPSHMSEAISFICSLTLYFCTSFVYLVYLVCLVCWSWMSSFKWWEHSGINWLLIFNEVA